MHASGAGSPGGLTERPLWTCPNCGHRFITANLWHSCSQYTLDERFAGSTPEARAAFDRFVELVERCGPVTVIAQKTRIVLMDRVRFAGAVVLRDRVRLNFALTRQLDAPWVERIEVYMGGRWNAHRFVARGPSDVDAIPDLPALLCESYRDLGAQGALRDRAALGPE
jgi:hypothetical protein